MKKPTNNSVIVRLVTKTRKDELRWDILESTSNITIYKAIYQLTDQKFVSYKLYHKKDKPMETHMVISLETMKYSYGRLYNIDIKRIRTIKDSERLILLLTKILEHTGHDIIRSVVSIIINKSNYNEILLVKRHDHDNTIPSVWVLPGGKINNNEEPSKAMRREVEEESGITPKQYKQIEYRNILKLRGKYYHIKVYVVTHYDGDLLEYPIEEIEDARWVNKEDIFNYYIGDETKKIIEYYIKNYNL